MDHRIRPTDCPVCGFDSDYPGRTCWSCRTSDGWDFVAPPEPLPEHKEHFRLRGTAVAWLALFVGFAISQVM
jgi:hypothetical protein